MSYKKAITWLQENSIPEQGIVFSNRQAVPCLSLTGSLIPTLIKVNMPLLAERYAEFIAYMQHPNGSFFALNGLESVFDSGQVLGGFLSACQRWEKFKPCALKTADYLLSHIEENGKASGCYSEGIPPQAYVSLAPLLKEAGIILGNPKYKNAALKIIGYYKNYPEILGENILSLFLAYAIDSFIECGENDFALSLAERVFSLQRKDGSIPAYKKLKWSCTAGTAYFALIGYKLGRVREADRIMDYLCRIQNLSGGFYGSYGLGRDYFPGEEIGLVNKFFLDAAGIWMDNNLDRAQDKETGFYSSPRKKIPALEAEEWERIIKSSEADVLAERLRCNLFPVWCRPLLEYTSADESILELGSGSGGLSAILAIYGRNTNLIDYSYENIKYSQRLFKKLGKNGNFICADIKNGIPLSSASVDWVFSSGLLEHFDDEEIEFIFKESARVAKKGVMSLFPNANSLFYRVGKFKMEKEGKWLYGREIPKFTLREFFQRAGLHNIKEYSIGLYDSLDFWGAASGEIKDFYNSLSPDEIRVLNQGYLLFTYGEK